MVKKTGASTKTRNLSYRVTDSLKQIAMQSPLLGKQHIKKHCYEVWVSFSILDWIAFGPDLHALACGTTITWLQLETILTNITKMPTQIDQLIDRNEKRKESVPW